MSEVTFYQGKIIWCLLNSDLNITFESGAVSIVGIDECQDIVLLFHKFIV